MAEESLVKPKSLRMRVGKVMEKKWRDLSDECECRKVSMVAQAERICWGVEDDMILEARSCDWESESTV